MGTCACPACPNGSVWTGLPDSQVWRSSINNLVIICVNEEDLYPLGEKSLLTVTTFFPPLNMHFCCVTRRGDLIVEETFVTVMELGYHLGLGHTELI